VSHDAWLIMVSRGVRTFSQSYLAVLFALYLDLLGFSLVQIGGFLSAGVAGAAFFAFVAGLVAQKLGRRRLLVGFTLMSAVAGLGLYFINAPFPMLALVFLGSVAGDVGGGASPTQPIEQASLPDTAPAERRTDLFALYGIVARAGTALGALAAGLPALYQDALGLGTLDSYRLTFLGFAALQLATALLYSLLSPQVEAAAGTRGWTNPLKLPSRRRIFTLTGLYSLDTFTTAMVTQALVAYWFTTRFGIDLGAIAFILFFSHVLSAISLWLAARIAGRIGLLNTMVFTHIPSSLFTIAAALAPTTWPWLAVLFWQLRSFLGQMDSPTRDSYTMAVVRPEERVATASLNFTGRSLAASFGPAASTALWNGLSAGAPFLASSVLKISYDLSLYALFRRVKPPEEATRPRAGR
jgi:MFS family permease